MRRLPEKCLRSNSTTTLRYKETTFQLIQRPNRTFLTTSGQHLQRNTVSEDLARLILPNPNLQTRNKKAAKSSLPD